MTTDYSFERRHFGPAFELAYFIHASKEIAFFVAEDALDSLASTLCHQKKNRKPSARLQGFLKWGERSRPVRKTAGLDEQQMLQWLVYKHSETWERKTEEGEGLYLPTEEDMVVRYLAHLVFLTTRSGSFYVTLAVGSLLYQFNRRTARLFYDVLTQSDSARMKDTSYIGKQRLMLLEKVSRRFGEMILTVRGAGDEKQFQMQETSPRLNELVRGSLQRFTPWGTACVIAPRFEVTDIPGLYLAEEGVEAEELIELNRMHTVLDPVCFARFAGGLSGYIKTLPDTDQDKSCDYDRLEERLSIPRFSPPPGQTPRGDRFQPPGLGGEDYIRLERTLEARAHRRRNFTPKRISVYVDDVLTRSFDPEQTKRIRQLIGAGVVEVRGRDEAGELILATLPAYYGEDERAPRGGTIVHPGGQKITIRLTPAGDAGGATDSSWLEVSFAKRGLMRSAHRLARTAWSAVAGRWAGEEAGLEAHGRRRAWAITAGVAAALMLAAVFLIRRVPGPPPPPREVAPAEQVALPKGDEGGRRDEPVITTTPLPTPETQPAPKRSSPELARAAWRTDREAALLAVPLELTRGESRVVGASRGDAKIVVSLPLYDERGTAYTRYRVTLSSGESRLWRQTLRAPKVSLTGYTHTLELALFAQRLKAPGPYVLAAEGRAKGPWRPVGKVTLSLRDR
jgi:hypothetical protein